MRLDNGQSLNRVTTLTIIIFQLVNSEEERVGRGHRDLELHIDVDQYPWVEHDVLCTLFVLNEALWIKNSYQDVGLPQAEWFPM